MGMYNDEVITDFGLGGFDKSRTLQSHRDDCDINKILQKYARTGDLSLLNAKPSLPNGDFTNALDFQESMNLVANATSLFNSQPAHIRDRFSNDVASFLAFMNDDKNLPEAGKLGIIDYVEAPDVVVPPVVETPPEKV